MFTTKYLIRKRQIGDVIWIEPLIRELAKRHKKIIVFTKYNDLFKNYPCPNVIFKNKLNFLELLITKIEHLLKSKFISINLNMAYERNSKKHFLHAYQEKVGLPYTSEYPKIYLSTEESETNLVSSSKYVILHLESLSDRNYRKVNGVNWEEVVFNIKKRGFEVFILGKNPVSIVGATKISTNLRELISILSKSSFFIGIDSGPSHIAASLSVPSLIFFGAVKPEYRHFKNLFKGITLQQPCEFAGCYHEVRATKGPPCKLVSDKGIPKCSIHSTSSVINHIDLLIKSYVS